MEEIVRRYQSWLDGEPLGPYQMEIYPTMRCNLHCRYCDTALRNQKPGQAPELTLEQVQRILEQAIELDVRKLSILGGGEPLEATDQTMMALELAKKAGMEVLLGTNATLLDGSLAEKVVELGLDELHVSLDGPDRETHDALRDNSFKRVAGAIARLASARQESGTDKPRMVAHCVVTRLNLERLPHLVEFAAENGIARINFDHVIPYLDEMKELKLTGAEAGKVHEIVDRVRQRASRLGLEHDAENLLMEGASERGRIEHPLGLDHGLVAGVPCFFPWFYISVRSDGTCGPCCVASGKLPSLKEHSLEEIWFGPYFEHVREYIMNRIMMDYCSRCSGALMAHNEVIRQAFKSEEERVRLLDAKAVSNILTRHKEMSTVEYELNKWLAASRDKIQELNRVVEVQNQLNRRLARFEDKFEALSRIAETQAKIVEMMREEIKKLSAELARVEAERARVQYKYDAASADLERMHFYVGEYKDKLAGAEEEKARLHQELFETRAKLDQYSFTFERVEQNLETRLREVEFELDQARLELSKLSDEKFQVERERDEKIADLKARLQALQEVVKDREKRLEAISTSKSWRLLKALGIVR